MTLLHRGDRGIDVSGWQREPIPWDDLGLQFAIVKATEGQSHVSRGWKLHAREVRRRGMVLGAYHFMHLDADPGKQARHFADVLTLRGPMPDFVALDVEWSKRHDPKIKPRLRVKRIEQWFSEVEARLALPALIYTQASYARYRLADHPDLRRWALWQAGSGEIDGWPAAIVQRVERADWYGGRKIDFDRVLRDWPEEDLA